MSLRSSHRQRALQWSDLRRYCNEGTFLAETITVLICSNLSLSSILVANNAPLKGHPIRSDCRGVATATSSAQNCCDVTNSAMNTQVGRWTEPVVRCCRSRSGILLRRSLQRHSGVKQALQRLRGSSQGLRVGKIVCRCIRCLGWRTQHAASCVCLPPMCLAHLQGISF